MIFAFSQMGNFVFVSKIYAVSDLTASPEPTPTISPFSDPALNTPVENNSGADESKAPKSKQKATGLKATVKQECINKENKNFLYDILITEPLCDVYSTLVVALMETFKFNIGLVEFNLIW